MIKALWLPQGNLGILCFNLERNHLVQPSVGVFVRLRFFYIPVWNQWMHLGFLISTAQFTQNFAFPRKSSLEATISPKASLNCSALNLLAQIDSGNLLLGAKREPTEWLLRVEPLGFGEWRLVCPPTD